MLSRLRSPVSQVARRAVAFDQNVPLTLGLTNRVPRVQQGCRPLEVVTIASNPVRVRMCATSDDSQVPPVPEAVEPSRLQLQRLFVHAAIPMVAFGIVDQSVLIYMGDVIDNSVGVYFGLPTLAAAAMGQVFSDTSGVLFGGTIESIALKTGLPLPGLTEAQQRMTVTKVYSTAGGVVGVITGCLIGMLNLLVIDCSAAERAKRQKELETIMKTVIDDGRKVVTCERATLWMVDAEASELWSKTASGIEHEIRIPLDAGVAGWVYANAELVNIEDVAQDERFTKARAQTTVKKVDAAAGTFQTKSMLCAPVKKGDQVVGVIQCLNKVDESTGEPIPFQANDEKIIRMLATHVGIFVEQADL